MVSSPPRPLACIVSLEPISSVNGTRLVRSNLIRAPLGWTVNTSPAVGDPLTSTASLPAPPSMESLPSPLFHTSVSLPADPLMTSPPFAPTRRSLPGPPSSESPVSEPVSTSSPEPPLSPAVVISVLFASTASESFPSPPLTTTPNVPLAGTVWSPGVALSQSEPLLIPPLVWPCTSRPPDTDTVTLSSAASRFSVANPPAIDAELTAACAGTAVAAKLAATAAPSAARIVLGLISSPLIDCCRSHRPPNQHLAHRAHPLTSPPEHCTAAPRRFAAERRIQH